MATHAMTTDIGHGGESGMSWLRGLSLRLEAWLERRRQYRDTYRELSRLSDRDLDDIGLARCDIPTIARETALGTSPVR